MAELPPLRASDGTSSHGGVDEAFTRHSLLKRLPAILEEILRRNPGLPSDASLQIAALRQSIEADNELAADLTSFAKAQENGWSKELRDAAIKWTELPWFAAENLAYLCVARACGAADVFQGQKDEALASAATPSLRIIAALTMASEPRARIRAALHCALWGNRADLSLTAGKAYEHSSHGSSEAEHLLADDSDAAVDLLMPTDGSRRHVVLVLDNCGLELLCDLALSDVLLSTGAATQVTLLAKAQPVFVSDAMPKDVAAHVHALRSMAAEAGERGEGEEASAAADLHSRLEAYLSSGSLVVQQHDFFHGPSPLWDMPAALHATMASAALVISKGDANYRRILGDRHWPHATPFAEAAAYFPSPLLALRTCKSGIAVGIDSAVEAAVKAREASFLLTGRYGVIQLKR